jgi:hypothetical protein
MAVRLSSYWEETPAGAELGSGMPYNSGLMTGAAGFVGLRLAEQRLSLGWHAAAVDASTSYYAERHKPQNLGRRIIERTDVRSSIMFIRNDETYDPLEEPRPPRRARARCELTGSRLQCTLDYMIAFHRIELAREAQRRTNGYFNPGSGTVIPFPAAASASV